MKRFAIILTLLLLFPVCQGQIIADHTVVDRFADIPQRYISEVRKMWVVVAGESHSEAYRDGLELLELAYPAYQVNVTEEGTPEAYTDSYLRISNATWGDYDNETGWIYWYGEEDWWTNTVAVERTREGISYCNVNNLTISAFGFGWCYDPMGSGPTYESDPEYGCRWWGASVNGPDGNKAWGLDASDHAITGNAVSMETYIAVTQGYIDFCNANNIPTKVFFTTGPVDNWNNILSDENMFQAHLKYEYLRNYISAHPDAVFFDYADILCYDDGSLTQHTVVWNGNIFPMGTVSNVGISQTGHITNIGATRLAKAMWWMLARIAGWDGFRETQWTGSLNSSWNEPGNWSNGVPDALTDAIIPDLAVDPVIQPGTGASCNNIEIHGDAVVTVNSDALSSGSLIVHGTASGRVDYNRRMPDDILYHYVSSPVGAASLPVSATFWAWNEPAGDWGDPVTANSPGNGYTVKANNSIIPFSGTIITDEVSVGATSPYSDCDFPFGTVVNYNERPYAQDRDPFAGYGGGGWNLLGNPYTSAIDAEAFIAQNDASFDQYYKALYIYNGDNYSYIGTELAGWENAGGTFGHTNIQASQGFFVAARCNSSRFTFTPAMRVLNTTVPYTKSTGEAGRWPGLKVKMTCGSNEASTLIVYNDEMKAGLDPGYDIGLMSSGGGLEIYTSLISGAFGVNFARQALPVSRADTIAVPVGIELNEGGTVTFSAETVPVGLLRFWLEDRATGVFTDIGLHDYTINLPSNSSGTGRFFIIASASTPSGIFFPDTPDGGLRIWLSGDKIEISGKTGEGSVCELIDIQGRVLLKRKLADGENNKVDLPVGLNGVIIVRVTDGNVVLTRKLVVQ